MGYKKSKLIEKQSVPNSNQFHHTELPDGEYNTDQINARTAARLAEYEAKYQMHSEPGISNNATPKPVKPVAKDNLGSSPSQKPVTKK